MGGVDLWRWKLRVRTAGGVVGELVVGASRRVLVLRGGQCRGRIVQWSRRGSQLVGVGRLTCPELL